MTDGTGSVVLLAETKLGVMAAWTGFNVAEPSGEGVFVRTLDMDGQPTAPTIALAAPGAGALYEFTLAASPSGDVIVARSELDEATASFRVYLIALGPDGTPRGAPTSLGTFEQFTQPRIFVDVDGKRALLVASGAQAEFTHGVMTLPLRCQP